jgi:hypothetical protein
VVDQELLALIVVGMTAAGFFVGWIRKRRRGPAPLCGGGCVCPDATGRAERGVPGSPVETPRGKR